MNGFRILPGDEVRVADVWWTVERLKSTGIVDDAGRMVEISVVLVRPDVRGELWLAVRDGDMFDVHRDGVAA